MFTADEIYKPFKLMTVGDLWRIQNKSGNNKTFFLEGKEPS